jgi:hypothetical protein
VQLAALTLLGTKGVVEAKEFIDNVNEVANLNVKVAEGQDKTLIIQAQTTKPGNDTNVTPTGGSGTPVEPGTNTGGEPSVKKMETIGPEECMTLADDWVEAFGLGSTPRNPQAITDLSTRMRLVSKNDRILVNRMIAAKTFLGVHHDPQGLGELAITACSMMGCEPHEH